MRRRTGAENVKINDRGEFTIEYGTKRFGVESPIEQSHRHERVLRRIFERVGIAARAGGINFHHVVMYHPRAVIERPPIDRFNTKNVIKADQFPTWHAQFVDQEIGVGAVLKGLANMRSLEAAREWGEKLIRQHRPVDPLSLPSFMQPKVPQEQSIRPIQVKEETRPSTAAKRLICLHCNSKISFAEGRFCWNNEPRFRGGQYCREHQALF